MNDQDALDSKAKTPSNQNTGVNLTPCAARAGLPYPTWGSSGLAKLYGLPLSGPLPVERGDLGDLAWAVNLALNGLIPSEPWRVPDGWARVVEFCSFLYGHRDAVTVRVVATLRQESNGQTVLKLSVPDEREPSPQVRVLVIDEDEEINKCVCLLLRRRGFDVIALKSGVRALEIAREEKPDLILLDVDLPGADGFAVCRALKAETRTSTIPVVFCTARSGLKKKVAAVGALECLEKPLGLIGLPEKLHQLLTHFRTANRRSEELPDSSDHASNS